MVFPGITLQNKREQLGFSRQDITDHLSIPADVILAFESADRDNFPDWIFAVGFLRSCCSFLGIEAESMIAELELATKKTTTVRQDHAGIAFRLPAIQLPRFSITIPPEVVAWVSVTALVLLGWFTYSTVIPSNTNQTEAMSIGTKVPDVRYGRE
ncbi:MAG: helix-turn-helix domain-containing protein [Candidatus Hydrogenedentota bacterium]